MKNKQTKIIKSKQKITLELDYLDAVTILETLGIVSEQYYEKANNADEKDLQKYCSDNAYVLSKISDKFKKASGLTDLDVIEHIIDERKKYRLEIPEFLQKLCNDLKGDHRMKVLPSDKPVQLL